jgi:hypothetical protein
LKTLLKIIILGIVIAVTWQYLENNNINIKEKLADSADWLKLQLKEIESSANKETADRADSEGPEITQPEQVTASVSEDNHNNQISNSIVTGSSTGVPVIAAEINNNQKIETELKLGSSNEEFEWVKTATEKYSPDSWYLLMQYDQLPEKAEALLTDGQKSTSNKPADTFHYVEGSSLTRMITSMATNVHEISHGYYHQNTFRYASEHNLQLAWDNAEGFIYISPEKSFFISFPKKYLFPSGELKQVIPQSLRTYRYDTYIDGNTSTQQDGVFGLLNEMNAYFLGSRLNFDMLNAYKTAEGSDTKGLIEWIKNSQSEMTAYYEFNFFIREYLMYMKQNHSDSYAEMKLCKNFTEAYREVGLSYSELIDKYQKRVDSEMKNLNTSGKAKAWMDAGELWVQESGSNSSYGTPVFNSDREKLLPVLAGDRYREISSDLR